MAERWVASGRTPWRPKSAGATHRNQQGHLLGSPTKTSAETSAVAGVCAALAIALAADRATAAQPDVIP
jgi:hypothetical protein